MEVTKALIYGNQPLGVHECIIISAEELVSRNGDPMVKICFDIEENGEFDHYLQNLSNSIGSYRDYYSWPAEGTKYFTASLYGLSYFRDFILKLEEYNDIKINMTIGENLDLSQFIGLKIGCEFGLEEYEKDGKVKVSMSILYFRTLEQLKYIKDYNVKCLNGKIVSGKTYESMKDFYDE